VKRQSKKQIKAAIDKLKEKPPGSSDPSHPPAQGPAGGNLSQKKSSMRIRKQGV
jgi:hypothetical protein